MQLPCHSSTALVVDRSIRIGDDPQGGARIAVVRGMGVGFPIQRLMGHGGGVA